MKAALVILALAGTALGSIIESDLPGCNANNCLREVRATRFGIATEIDRWLECNGYAVTYCTNAGYAPFPLLFPFSRPSHIKYNTNSEIFEVVPPQTPKLQLQFLPMLAIARALLPILAHVLVLELRSLPLLLPVNHIIALPSREALCLTRVRYDRDLNCLCYGTYGAKYN